MADASTTRSAFTYTSLVAAIVIPVVQKHYGITMTISDVADGMAGAALAWHGISTFIETRWPAKSQATEPDPEVITAVTRAVLQELKSSVPFVPTSTEEKHP